MMHPSNNRFVRNIIEIPILAICNNIAFGKNISIFIKNNVVQNKRTYKIIGLTLTILTSFFFLGYASSLDTIKYLKYNEELIISNLSKITSKLVKTSSEKTTYKTKYHNIIYSDDYMRYIAYTESDILIPKDFDMKHLRIMFQQADSNKIPYRIMFRLIWKESRYVDNLKFGYMQVMEDTKQIYRKLLKLHISDPIEENIVIGCHLLKDLYTTYRKKHNKEESWKLALASYNAGIGNVEKYKGIPPFTETIDYVNFITKK